MTISKNIIIFFILTSIIIIIISIIDSTAGKQPSWFILITGWISFLFAEARELDNYFTVRNLEKIIQDNE